MICIEVDSFNFTVTDLQWHFLLLESLYVLALDPFWFSFSLVNRKSADM
jgi:hypothetical protein